MTNQIEIIIVAGEEQRLRNTVGLVVKVICYTPFPFFLPLDVLNNQRYVTSFSKKILKWNRISFSLSVVSSSSIRASGIYQSENFCYDWNNDKAYNSVRIMYVTKPSAACLCVGIRSPRMFIMPCWHKTARRPHLHFYRIYPCFHFYKQIVTITTSNFSTPNHLRPNFF